MNKITVNLGDRTYPICITTGYDELGKSLTARGINKKVVLITDENVDKLQSEECIKAIRLDGFEVLKYVIPAGEMHKNLDTVNGIYSFLVANKCDRKSTLLALGGGVVGDITGYAAATFLRGVNFVQVPTTLLSQADSSVGGKVGVDFGGFKNMVGAFYQPKLVYINVNSLNTLPQRQIQNGLAEVVKHGVIADKEFLEYVEYNLQKIFTFDENVLQYLTKQNCRIKANVVEQDEKEAGLRAILNFGHTIGHAVETHSKFELLHGEAIAIGMMGALLMAQKLQMISGQEVGKVVRILNKIGLPTSYANMDAEKVYELLFHDKKVKTEKLHFILPKSIGEVLEVAIDDKSMIMEILEKLTYQ